MRASDWLQERERPIVFMEFGSTVYGTRVPSSDTDYKGVFLPDPKQILLQRATKVSRNSSTGNETGKNTKDDIDFELFSLHGYMKLLCEGQTIAIDMLFVPSQHWISWDSIWDQVIVHNKQEWVSKSITPFVGYCHAQANKYGIKGSRMAAIKKAKEAFNRLCVSGCGLDKLEYHGGRLKNELEGTEHISFPEILQPGGQMLTHLEVCGRKIQFNARVDYADRQLSMIWEKYGERARQAMTNEGIDWKAVMHAHRICDQAIELLDTGEITFPRQNADLLLKIRNGELQYRDVAEELEAKLETLKIAERDSSLRQKPNVELSDEIVETAYRNAVK